ncbi:phosphoribosylformylglycinamidine synthase-associated small membrane protein [Pseudovibrio ascidiaceicola]|uniref:phosphoribosylformylglycinamidine synthase-associated small membrane protein n=1 Tax=Pseudovibrio ascidiaceicola TaxID=285279 RepID=UPI003D363AFC
MRAAAGKHRHRKLLDRASLKKSGSRTCEGINVQDDTGRIIRFMIIKAIIFIGLPAALSVLAVFLLL